MRGIVGDLGLHKYDGYRSEIKVEILNSQVFWYSHLNEKIGEVRLADMVSNLLDKMKAEIEAYTDRQVIYFIATRPRIRLRNRPSYGLFRKIVTLPLEMGPRRLKKNLRIPFYYKDLETGKKYRFRFDWSETSLTLRLPNLSNTFSIHDFFANHPFEFGHYSKITYIGRTDDPGRRPIDGNHRGLSHTLRDAQEENEDVFIYINIFKVTIRARIEGAAIEFVMNNKMIDQIDMKSEADLIEKCLIYYFSPKTQEDGRHRDSAILRNTLQRLKENFKAQSVSINIEMENPNPYYRFSSDSIKPSNAHFFTLILSEEGKIITEP